MATDSRLASRPPRANSARRVERDPEAEPVLDAPRVTAERLDQLPADQQGGDEAREGQRLTADRMPARTRRRPGIAAAGEARVPARDRSGRRSSAQPPLAQPVTAWSAMSRAGIDDVEAGLAARPR